MKKTLSVILCVLMLGTACLSLSACQIGDAKTLVLGFDCEYPPYGYLDTESGEYVGFDLEYAAAVCEDIGYKLELVPIDWTAKDSQLNSGVIDCIWNGFTINGREDDYEWTVPYVDNSIVVLTAADSGITDLAGLAGKTVTVQGESSGESALKDEKNTALVASFKNGEYLKCTNYNTAFQELTAGAVDAIVIDIGVAEYLIEGQSDYVILSQSVSTEQYGVGFKKGNTELRDIIQAAMLRVAKDTDTVKTLAEKYGISDSVIIGK